MSAIIQLDATIVFSAALSQYSNRGYYHCCDGLQTPRAIAPRKSRPFALTIRAFEVAGAAWALFRCTVCRARMTADRVATGNRSSMVIKSQWLKCLTFDLKGENHYCVKWIAALPRWLDVFSLLRKITFSILGKWKFPLRSALLERGVRHDDTVQRPKNRRKFNTKIPFDYHGGRTISAFAKKRHNICSGRTRRMLFFISRKEK